MNHPKNSDSHFCCPDAAFDIVAIAASAGGFKALQQLLADLPADFPTPVVVLLHVPANHHSLLAELLNHYARLPVQQVNTKTHLQAGTIYTAPPNYHLLVNRDGTVTLSSTPLLHYVRPSATCLFESIANNFLNRAIAVILTGKGEDGSDGAQMIKRQGGVVIAQNQQSCEHFSMPEAAISTGAVDYVLPLNQIASQLITLVHLHS